MSQYSETHCMRCHKPQVAAYENVLCKECVKFLSNPETNTLEEFFRMTKDLCNSVLEKSGNDREIREIAEKITKSFIELI